MLTLGKSGSYREMGGGCLLYTTRGFVQVAISLRGIFLYSIAFLGFCGIIMVSGGRGGREKLLRILGKRA